MWFDSRINYEALTGANYTTQSFKLERVEALHRRLGSPLAKFPVVHVTGTKGKGSTSAMIARILQNSGRRTGLFHSPHLRRLEERFLIDGVPCSSEDLREYDEILRPIVESMDADERAGKTNWGIVTWFELTAMIAFLHFAKYAVDAAVLEVGMGGRLDATNICRPQVSVITNISLDHTAQLGNTIAAIAREKAGIIKENTPVVSGASQPEAVAEIEKMAAEKNASLFLLGRDFAWENRYEVGMHGRHQQFNAALAVQVVRLLREQSWEISERAVQTGLKEAVLPGRLEVVSEKPLVILDVAHNEISIDGTLQWLMETYPNRRKRVVFAVSGDKNWPIMLRKIAAVAEKIYLTEYHTNQRAAKVSELAAFCRENGIPAESEPDSLKCVELAGQGMSDEDLLLVVGSFFLIGEVR